MEKATIGNRVKVHYTGKIDAGFVFDSSADREPLEFTLGSGQIIPGFESAVVGMVPGETKTIRIPSNEAYGPHRKELIVDIGREHVPPHIEPKPGLMVQIKQEDGSVTDLVITGVTDTHVTLDANHPLAGQDLTFEIKLVDIA
ncbi:MAG: FKBP-type peptidyl-prolyl cis-trans isomerase [bacterium]